MDEEDEWFKLTLRNSTTVDLGEEWTLGGESSSNSGSGEVWAPTSSTSTTSGMKESGGERKGKVLGVYGERPSVITPVLLGSLARLPHPSSDEGLEGDDEDLDGDDDDDDGDLGGTFGSLLLGGNGGSFLLTSEISADTDDRARTSDPSSAEGVDASVRVDDPVGASSSNRRGG